MPKKTNKRLKKRILGMNITPLSFSDACRQFGNATYHLAQSIWRAPFTGGPVRMVTIGLPVLFLTAGVGAIIYGIAKSIFSYIGNTWKKRSHPQTPPNPPQVIIKHVPHIPIPKIQENTTQETTPVEREHIERIPLPEEAGKERNAAFNKLLKLVDDFIIGPWIIENQTLLDKGKQIDPLFEAMIESPKDLKTFLRAIALWQFGIQWGHVLE